MGRVGDGSPSVPIEQLAINPVIPPMRDSLQTTPYESPGVLEVAAGVAMLGLSAILIALLLGSRLSLFSANSYRGLKDDLDSAVSFYILTFLGLGAASLTTGLGILRRRPGSLAIGATFCSVTLVGLIFSRSQLKFAAHWLPALADVVVAAVLLLVAVTAVAAKNGRSPSQIQLSSQSLSVVRSLSIMAIASAIVLVLDNIASSLSISGFDASSGVAKGLAAQGDVAAFGGLVVVVGLFALRSGHRLSVLILTVGLVSLVASWFVGAERPFGFEGSHTYDQLIAALPGAFALGALFFSWLVPGRVLAVWRSAPSETGLGAQSYAALATVGFLVLGGIGGGAAFAHVLHDREGESVSQITASSPSDEVSIVPTTPADDEVVTPSTSDDDEEVTPTPAGPIVESDEHSASFLVESSDGKQLGTAEIDSGSLTTYVDGATNGEDTLGSACDGSDTDAAIPIQITITNTSSIDEYLGISFDDLGSITDNDGNDVSGADLEAEVDYTDGPQCFGANQDSSSFGLESTEALADGASTTLDGFVIIQNYFNLTAADQSLAQHEADLDVDQNADTDNDGTDQVLPAGGSTAGGSDDESGTMVNLLGLSTISPGN